MKGSKTPRGKNSYLISIYIGIDPKTGKQKYHRETVHGTAEKSASKAADDRIAEIITQLNNNEYVAPTKMTFLEYLQNKWLPVAKAEIDSGTYDEYYLIVNKHIAEHEIANIPLTKIELEDIEEYKLWALQRPRLDGKKDKFGNPLKLSSKTVKNHLIAIKAAFSYACRAKYLKYNPAQHVKYPHITKAKMLTWTEDQAARFLDVAFYDRFYFLYLLAIFYGKRKGEIRALRRQDVDLKNLTMSIVQSVRKSGYSAQFKDTKTDETRQLIELEEWMVPYFEREFAERDAEKAAYGVSYNDNGLVFASINGNPVKERTLDEHYKKIIERAGVPMIRFHDLRHTCITIMLKRGWSLKHAQNRAAHATVQTTGDIYGHVTPTMQRDVNFDMAKALKIKLLG